MIQSSKFNLRDNPKSILFNERYPVVTATLQGWESRNAKLIESIATAGHRNISNTNLNAHRTGWRMWEDGQPHAEVYRELCEVACQLAKDQSPNIEWQPMVTAIWGAIYEQKDFARPHDHWPSTWSFVYFVDVGLSPSPLVFPNAQRAINPNNSMLCLFPGWVLHEVPPQKSNSRRVMVAGNISPKTQ